MSAIVVWVFSIAVALIVYVYVGYPFLCAALASVLRRWPRTDPLGTPGSPPADLDGAPAPSPRAGRRLGPPRVSVLVAAYNEAAHIAATVENKLAQDYPAERLEIVVVSDASDDGTDEIVARFRERGVRLIRQDPRQGKTAALNLAVPQLSGDVIAFSDANSLWARAALSYLVAPFTDPEIGYVTGRMVYRAADGSLTGEGCSAYMRYENRLRWWETGIGSIVGVDGGIDAVRRELYQPMRPDQLPDFVLPLGVRERGCRVVYEPRALLYEDALAAAADEWRMRVRVSLRAWHALRDKAALLDPFRYGLYSWQLLSHKVLRYSAGIWQAAAFLANLVGILVGGGPIWSVLLIAQLGFYGLAAGGALARGGVRVPVYFRFPYYLCLLNAASMLALIRFLQGKKQVTWKPRT
jgi:cellulose synthase/poly-beta-1,6-N-acetylglucosamine synthase-like glycosyltransferase